MERNGTPLHDAASQGDIDLVKQIYEKTPQLAQATDSRRRLALHLASARGHADITILLVSNDHLDMYTARDVDGRNPLHLAAMNGRVEVLKMLVEKCPHAAEARADRGETILHICFKYNHKEALESLLENAKIQELVNAKDDDGNTLLHLVVADHNATPINHEILKCLLACPNIDVSATNSHGHTPLDIAMMSEEKLKKLKLDKTVAELQVNALREEDAQTGRELGRIYWLAEKRDSLMVVASLIATMAFAAGLTPPGGLFQEDGENYLNGESVLAVKYPDGFSALLKSNTIGFVGSLSVILLLISELPFRKKFFMWALIVIMWATITAIAYTYALVVASVTPEGSTQKALSDTLNTGLVIWVSVMGILLLVHTIRLFWELRKVRSIRFYISVTRKKLGLGRKSVSGPANGVSALQV